ncbi:hypothetical protein Marpi_0910 [Marinitoga piezophila KA3]|uniref:Uncharacterized protein n=1 Tax=Marinitoga piezophila (strain DSM 14283 / JCM 11233 / KA3) TaxID=443254 RepID=H2J7D3_MARPK|nr:hypothetical protein Marpi_0910 [Marinitoga piezophila KA3]
MYFDENKNEAKEVVIITPDACYIMIEEHGTFTAQCNR